MNIFIPVLFICANVACEFQQARTYFTTLEDCVAAVETQHNMIVNQARVLGVDNLVVKATCVTVTVTTI
jgi:hypothetical protein